jgi:hypothetical protein
MPLYPEKSQNKMLSAYSKRVHFSLKCWVQNNKLWEEITVFISLLMCQPMWQG